MSVACTKLNCMRQCRIKLSLGPGTEHQILSFQLFSRALCAPWTFVLPETGTCVHNVRHQRGSCANGKNTFRLLFNIYTYVNWYAFDKNYVPFFFFNYEYFAGRKPARANKKSIMSLQLSAQNMNVIHSFWVQMWMVFFSIISWHVTHLILGKNYAFI